MDIPFYRQRLPTPQPICLQFTMIKNADFLGSLDTYPYKFRHYDISDFSLFVNANLASEGLSLHLNNEKSSVMGYRTLLEGSVINHSNS